MTAASECEMLPEDLVFHILAWLPVASLLRFKSVCKAWLSHIDSSRFISQHTHRVSSTEDDKLVLLHSFIQRYFYFAMNFISVNNLQLFKYVEFSPSDYLHDSSLLGGGRIIASFRGIICLYHNSRDGDGVFSDVVSLWNPATTEFTTLPPAQSDIKENLNSHHVETEYGVGFDVKNNDYKVVRVISESGLRDAGSYRSQVEVYSVSTGSWRIIDAVLPHNFFFVYNPKQPLQNDIYCWCGYDLSSRRSLILSFDFSKEAFGIMPIPDVCSNPFEYDLILAILREKIAIVCIRSSSDDCREFWVLYKYAFKESWTDPYKITLNQNDPLLGFSMDGKIIQLKGYDEPKLCLYDPHSEEVNEVSVQGLISETAIYKESLISVKSATGVTKSVIYEDLSKRFQRLLNYQEEGPLKIYLPITRTNEYLVKIQDTLVGDN